MRYALLLLTLSVALPGQPAEVVISQIYGGGGGNTGAPFRNDYVELFNRGTAPVSLGGWSVQYASASGTTWQVTPLSGMIAPGRYFLVQQAAGANAGAAPLPQPDATGTIAMALGAGQVALVRSTTALAGPSGAVDYVVYSGLSNSTAAIRRNNGCLDTDSFSDFQIGAPRPRNSAFEPRVDCSAAPEPPLPATISQIQGAGARSGLENRRVQTRGVVTGKKRDGFWIQSLPAEEDGDPVTSEGLWVYFGMSPPGTVERGYLVEVTGTVSEYRPASEPQSLTLTELVDPQFRVVAQGQALPAPVTLAAGIDWERFEGMRVTAPEVRVTGPTLGSVNAATATASSNGVFYGVLPAQMRPYRSPDPSDRVERLRIDSRAQGGRAVDVSTGASVRNVTGPLDYAFQSYSVVQDAGELMEVSGGARATTVPAAEAGEFTVATMNLQQLWDERDDPGLDVAVQPAALQARMQKLGRIVREALASPDIVGVQEAENEGVLRALALEAGDYDAHLLEGDDPSGIDVGLLVKRGRVVVRNIVQEGKGERIPGSNDLLWDRPPLAARVMVEGVPLTVIVVHLRSLIDADTAPVAAKRRLQAEFLGRLVQNRTQAGEQVLVMGDFNTYAFDPLMEIVRAGSLLNLSDTLPPSENYSYVYDGEVQSIDHILIGAGLRARLSRYAIARVNADFPEAWRGDVTALERASDHDIPVAYFRLAPEAVQLAAAGVVNAASFLGGPIAPLEIVTIFGRGLGPEQLVTFDGAGLGPALAGTRVLFDGVPGDVIYTSSGQVSVIVPVQMAARSMTRIEVEYQGRRTNGVMVPVAPAAPAIFTLSRTGTGAGAILNQDYSVNGSASPAERGSVVMIFGTGGGLLESTAGDVPARLRQPVSVRIGGKEAEVLWAGQAPGLVPGALQINARVPADLPAGEATVLIGIGDRLSALGVTLMVR